MFLRDQLNGPESLDSGPFVVAVYWANQPEGPAEWQRLQYVRDTHHPAGCGWPRTPWADTDPATMSRERGVRATFHGVPWELPSVRGELGGRDG